MRRWFGWLVVSCLVLCQSARADEISVAVAANFANTLEQLAASFQKASGHRLTISAGSSGQLYAQAKAGAPYDVFLSADVERAQALVREGLGVPGTRFVYARSKLALWSKQPGFLDARGSRLKQLKLAKLALADPRIAPHGAAAERVLKKLQLWDKLRQQGKIAFGTNVLRAYQLASSGKVECAFVAYTQVLSGSQEGSFWLVPESLYPPLHQSAVLLKAGDHKPAAESFLTWLKTDRKAIALVRAAGYRVGKR
jgi:molybdate transport system substrate-binding protein